MSVEGELDLASAPLLSDLIDMGLDVGKPMVVLEMSGITFMDSQGLKTLMLAEKRARESGISLVLRSPTTRVRDLLMLTGVESMFSIDPPASMIPG
jgi:anti-sigma B factor antagonist